jgi:hypothetical protein
MQLRVFKNRAGQRALEAVKKGSGIKQDVAWTNIRELGCEFSGEGHIWAQCQNLV